VELYGAYEQDRPMSLEPLLVQYADYAIWQRQYLEGDVLESKIAYWQEKLKGVAPLELPADYARPSVQSSKGAVTSFSIDKKTSSQIQQLGRNRELPYS
jgi:hypothetical protein